LTLEKADRNISVLVIFAVISTALVWAGDIFSWAWIGNGFLIDIIVLVVAILLTGGVVYLFKRKSAFKTSQEESNDSSNAFCCLNCGNFLEVTDDSCPACGTPLPVCIVCFTPFKKGDIIVQLPCCSNYAHKEHLLNFYEIKGYCPKCLEPFSLKDLIEMTFG